MKKVGIAITLWLTLGYVVGSSTDAIATCYQQFVRTSCPSGIVDSSLLPATSTPSAHAATHASGGTDPVTLAESQITGLTSDLSSKVTTTVGTVCAHQLTANVCPTYSETGADAAGAAAAAATAAEAYTDTVATGKVSTSTLGAPGGVATLGTDTKLTASQVPDLSATYVPWGSVEGTGTGTSTATNKIVHGGDARLSDSRAPTGSIYADGNITWQTGTNTITSTSAALSSSPKATLTAVPHTLLSITSNTSKNVSTSLPGFAPVLPNDATKFLNGVGAWAVPSGGGGGSGSNSITISSSTASPGSSISLGSSTSTGNIDWFHWANNYGDPGNSADTAYPRKRLGGYSIYIRDIGGGSRYNTSSGSGFALISTAADSSRNGAESWSSYTGVYNQLNAGWVIKVPASPTQKVLRIYGGTWSTRGVITARLSDNIGVADTVNNAIDNPNNVGSWAVYTITYTATVSGYLTVTYTYDVDHNGGGNITINLITLSSA